jgi:DNA-binding SARP family transcriptional activator/tetratricopeptide (TPR) repeat protein
VEFRLLGPVQIRSVGGEIVQLNRRKERLALSVLLLQPERIVTADRLIDLLWAQAPPPAARASLQTLMSRIRGALRSAADGDTGDPARLSAQGEGYVLHVEPQSVDLHRFRTLVDEARAIDDPSLRSARLTAALSLWRGPALAGTAIGALREQLCADLEESRFAAISDRIDADIAAGRHADLIPELSRLIAEHPLREQLHGQLMMALYRSGRRADALDAYRRARQRLVAELGLEPGPQLRRLESAIIADAPDLEAGVDHRLPGSGNTASTMTGSQAARPEASAPAVEEPVRPAQLPSDLGSFVGRTAYIRQLDSLLPEEHADRRIPTATVIAVIAGTGGVGKTSLAVHWAHRVRRLFPDGQLYVNLRGFDAEGASMSAAEALQGFLDALQVPGHRIPEGLSAQSSLYRSMVADRRMLIVLDNARDAEQVRPLLPGAPGCLVLITSRNRLSSLIVTEGARLVHVGLLSVAEARELLVSRCGVQRVTAEPEAVDEIVACCARLPLALAIVSARAAANPGFTLSALAGELRAADGGLDAFDGEQDAIDMRAVFSWSYRTLTTDAARLFRLLGLHAGPDIAIPAAASLAGIPVRKVRTLLAALTAAHLLTEQSPGRYTFHDLLRAYATELVEVHDTDADRRAALTRLFDHYLHTADLANRLLYQKRGSVGVGAPHPGVTLADLTDLRHALAWFSAEHHVLLAAIDHATEHGFDTHTWQLARVLTLFFQRGGLWHRMVATQRTVLDATSRMTDPEGLAHLHRSLAVALAALGRDDDAHTHLRYALDRFRELDDPIYQADTHMSLAWVCERLRRPEAVLHHCEQALALSRAAGQKMAQADALNGIGWAHARLGHYEQSLAYCREALALHEEVGDAHGEAGALDSLGFIHHHLDDDVQAVAYYQRALDRYRKVGSRYYETRTLTRLGDLHQTAADHTTARHTWQLALDILDELNHPDADQVRDRLTGADTGRS